MPRSPSMTIRNCSLEGEKEIYVPHLDEGNALAADYATQSAKDMGLIWRMKEGRYSMMI